jgi:hypothetical protein
MTIRADRAGAADRPLPLELAQARFAGQRVRPLAPRWQAEASGESPDGWPQRAQSRREAAHDVAMGELLGQV